MYNSNNKGNNDSIPVKVKPYKRIFGSDMDSWKSLHQKISPNVSSGNSSHYAPYYSGGVGAAVSSTNKTSSPCQSSPVSPISQFKIY